MALSNLNKENVTRLMESLAITPLENSKKSDMQKYNATSFGKLEMIMTQIKMLQSMALQTIDECEKNKILHNAICKFEKTPNNVYHFYTNENDELYCSLLSPEDWKGKPPHVHYGSYILKPDMEFYPV
jgi:hypothetical protein